jgi:hypothetical protein
MKKLYSTLAIGIVALSVNAQSQRLVLVEEFTQASCGPCAAANPSFNALLNNNAAKCVSIKYQTSWPGVDPMNAQYPTGVAARASYYSCQSVPYAVMDGDAVTGGSYTGAPGGLTTTKINNEYAIPSAFSMDISHYLNAAQDSIFITAHVTATQAFTGVNYPRMHCVLVEKHIDFATPPGSNGETDFYMVCRKMLPNQTGTMLPITWASGDDTIINIKAAVPSYIYDVNQLAVVCFLQDNGNKDVLQAGYSISPVGIHNFVNMPLQINLFPNPSSASVKVNFSLETANEVSFNIYSMSGELVLSEKRGNYLAGKNEMDINVEMLATGMYNFELIAGEVKSTSLLNIVH